MITLSTELARIRGLSPPFLGRLEKLDIRTVKDVLWHFPFRYDDFSAVSPIADLQLNQSATVQGVVRKVATRRSWRRNMMLVEAVVSDASGDIRAIWFNQPYIGRILRPGLSVNLAGRVMLHDENLSLSNPAYEIVRSGGETKHTGGLIPVYPETRGLTSRGIRYLVRPLLKVIGQLPDFIPPEVLSREGLPPLTAALRSVHFPTTLEEADRAKRRFAFENLFLLQLNNLKFRSALARAEAPAIPAASAERETIVSHLPFTLTAPQTKSLDEILGDLTKHHPMNRLLQGDVGSGKTVVAATAAILSARAGWQVVFMAPTEVLARQHYETLVRTFGKLLAGWNIAIGLLMGSEARLAQGAELERGTSGRAAKSKLKKGVEEHAVNITVGTHALISGSKKSGDALRFPALGLIIVDEQHRFGVEQRAALTKRHALVPHFLSMSATPIPRTLSLTLFGDLDVSIINELPKGRQPIVTKVVDPANRDKAYAFVREHIKAGRQAFVVCPRIELTTSNQQLTTNSTKSPVVSGKLSVNLWDDVKAVKEEYEKLSQKIFPDLVIAMLHGKLKSGEKAAVMGAFQNGETNILVSTSVIEVGVDVPNATLMIIEGAERFGLAQLYQFRGRIGRGEHQSFCLLFTDSTSESVRERLDALLKAKNGFELAEQDLALRGPGQFLGQRQTGLPDLAMKSLSDFEFIKRARESARLVFQNDPLFKTHPLLKEKLASFESLIHLE